MMTFNSKIRLLALLGFAFASTARGTVLTFDKTTQFTDDFPAQRLFGAPSTSVFSDYGDRVDWTGSPSVVDQDASAARGQLAGTTTFHYGPTGGQTPNVVVDYTTNGSSSEFGAGTPGGAYAYNYSGDPTRPALLPYYDTFALKRYLTFTADPGYEVVMESFMVRTVAATDQSIRYLRLVGIDALNNETTLWSVGDPAIGDVAVNNTVFNTVQFGSVAYRGIALDLQPLSAEHNFFGLDSIQIGQQLAPEPASAGLLLLGLAGFARRSRHRGV